MADLLDNLAARALGRADVVLPRPAPRFAPAPAEAWGEVTFELDPAPGPQGAPRARPEPAPPGPDAGADVSTAPRPRGLAPPLPSARLAAPAGAQATRAATPGPSAPAYAGAAAPVAPGRGWAIGQEQPAPLGPPGAQPAAGASPGPSAPATFEPAPEEQGRPGPPVAAAALSYGSYAPLSRPPRSTSPSDPLSAAETGGLAERGEGEAPGGRAAQRVQLRPGLTPDPDGSGRPGPPADARAPAPPMRADAVPRGPRPAPWAPGREPAGSPPVPPAVEGPWPEDPAAVEPPAVAPPDAPRAAGQGRWADGDRQAGAGGEAVVSIRAAGRAAHRVAPPAVERAAPQSPGGRGHYAGGRDDAPDARDAGAAEPGRNPAPRRTQAPPPSASPQQAPPAISVTIGRVEVRATQPAPAPKPQRPAGGTASLDDYLRERRRR